MNVLDVNVSFHYVSYATFAKVPFTKIFTHFMLWVNFPS